MILNRLKNIRTNTKIFLFFLFSILITVLIVNLIIIPKVNFIKESGHSIVERRKFLEEQYERVKNLKQGKIDIERIQSNIGRLDEVFVNHEQDLEFIQTLEELANKNNVAQNISMSNAQKIKNEYEEIILEINLEGSFYNIMRYLIDLETLEHYVNIKSLNINSLDRNKNLEISAEDSSSASRVSCKIVADTYWK